MFRSYARGIVLAAVLVAVITPSHATLLARAGGSMVYDTDLNVTWLADANYAKTSGYSTNGLLTWSQASLWVRTLSFRGFKDWRLPYTPQYDNTCSGDGYMAGLGTYSYGAGCTASELGYLHNVEGVSNGAAEGPFSNIGEFPYWSTTFQLSDTMAWYEPLNSLNENQNVTDKQTEFYVLPVRDGDVVTSVPLPGAGGLLGSGLAGFAIWGVIGFFARGTGPGLRSGRT